MRTETDALRSLAKYLSMSLGDAWEIRWTDEEGVFERPFLQITGLPVMYRSHGPFHAEKTRTFPLTAYPLEGATPDGARLNAEAVVTALHKAFGVGTHSASFGRKQNAGVSNKVFRRAHPYRIPLWDYDGIALSEAATDADRAPNDFMKVIDPPTFGVVEGTARSDEEETLWVVTGEVRLSWSVATGLLEDGVGVADVTGTFVADID